MKLEVLPGTFAVCRLHPDEVIPSWVNQKEFCSVSRSPEELSVVCEQSSVPSSIKAERDWKIIKVQGPLDFGLTGILASIVSPLAKAQISIFAVSTFDTDYVLVKHKDLGTAIESLKASGHEIPGSPLS